jgi:hypothetical protein
MADSSRYGNSEASRRRLAMAMMEQGMDTSPIASPWQGIARMAQAIMGGYNMHTLDKEEKAREAKDEADWTSLPGLDGASSEAAGWQTSVAPTNGPKENIASPAPTSRFTPEESAEIKALMANPATRKVGLDLYMEKLKPKGPDYEFRTVGKNLVRADGRTGKAESVFTASEPDTGASDAALLEALGITAPGAAPQPLPAMEPNPAALPPAAAPAPSQAAPAPAVQQGPPAPPPGRMNLGGPMQGQVNPDTGNPYTPMELDEATQGANPGALSPEMQMADAGESVGLNLSPEQKARLGALIGSKDPAAKKLGRAIAQKLIQDSITKAPKAAAPPKGYIAKMNPEGTAAVTDAQGRPVYENMAEATARAKGTEKRALDEAVRGKMLGDASRVVETARNLTRSPYFDQALHHNKFRINLPMIGDIGNPVKAIGRVVDPDEPKWAIGDQVEQVQNSLNLMVGKAYLEGQGSVSNFERQMVTDAIGTLSNATSPADYQFRLNSVQRMLQDMGSGKITKESASSYTARPDDREMAAGIAGGNFNGEVINALAAKYNVEPIDMQDYLQRTFKRRPEVYQEQGQ